MAARVLGQSAKIFVTSNYLKIKVPGVGQVPLSGGNSLFGQAFGGANIPVGEFDKFSSKQEIALRPSRPIGATKIAPNMAYGGWQMSMSGGKVDSGLTNLIQSISTALEVGSIAPKFTILQKIVFYDGRVEEFWYPDAIIHDYSIDIVNGQEIVESILAYAPTRVPARFSAEEMKGYLTFAKEAVRQEAQNAVADLSKRLLSFIPL